MRELQKAMETIDKLRADNAELKARVQEGMQLYKWMDHVRKEFNLSPDCGFRDLAKFLAAANERIVVLEQKLSESAGHWASYHLVSGQRDALQKRIRQLEADCAALRKAVEWMREVGKFYEYKAPEQINTTSLMMSMIATADDALSAETGASLLAERQKLRAVADDAREALCAINTIWHLHSKTCDCVHCVKIGRLRKTLAALDEGAQK